MPRRPRVFVEGGIYHVYNRFARGAEIFRDLDEAERFRELLQEVRRRDGNRARHRFEELPFRVEVTLDGWMSVPIGPEITAPVVLLCDDHPLLPVVHEVVI